MIPLLLCIATTLGTVDPVTVSRGLAGTVEFEYSGPKLIAEPHERIGDPLRIRLSGPRDGNKYVVRFIGNKAGEYDLRDHMFTETGDVPAGLEPLRVVVLSKLPANHGSDIFEVGGRDFSLEPYYFRLLWILGLAWIALPIVAGVRRLCRRIPQKAVVPVRSEPTIPERIRGLVLVAAQGKMTIAEQGALELLLIAYHRDELKLESMTPSEALMAIRAHDRAGELLRTVEQWIHAPRAVSSSTESAVHDVIMRSIPELSGDHVRGVRV